MPSKQELSKIMKGAGYSVPENTKASLHQCLTQMWNGNADPNMTRQCEQQAMGSKEDPSSVGAQFAKKWN